MVQLYKGDITSKQAWEMLKNSNSLLVDVRTSAEWHYVGAPDLSSIKGKLIQIEWRKLPSMDKNLEFIKQFESIVSDKNADVIFLCRTGGRSQEAAIEMTKEGYANCYNVEFGFEGEISPSMHRGTVNGWKADKLPWRQV